MIEVLISNLNELDTPSDGDEQFICGERTAYVECLEILQTWKYAKKHRLDFNVEQRFPLL